MNRSKEPNEPIISSNNNSILIRAQCSHPGPLHNITDEKEKGRKKSEIWGKIENREKREEKERRNRVIYFPHIIFLYRQRIKARGKCIRV